MFSRIQFCFQSKKYSINYQAEIRKWIHTVVSAHNAKLIHLIFVFCDDEYLQKINNKSLGHSTLTDVISFQVGEGVEGEIYISLQRVKENAKKLNLSYIEEVKRVVIHGVLHMIGYKDATEEERKEMRKQEDQALGLFVSRETKQEKQ